MDIVQLGEIFGIIPCCNWSSVNQTKLNGNYFKNQNCFHLEIGQNTVLPLNFCPNCGKRTRIIRKDEQGGD